MLFCGLKSILNLIQSPMFCKQIFKFYHLRKCYSKLESGFDDEFDTSENILRADMFKSFFKQILRFSLVRSPLAEFFSIAYLERCMSVLHCKVLNGYNEESKGMF